MSRSVPNTLRAAVAKRAGFRCEYCRVHQNDMVFTFQADHIISRKHGGLTVLENLANACSVCNQNKSSDLGTYLPGSNRLIRLFNPRKDNWEKHFKAVEGEIIPLTKIGEATAKVLDLNDADRVNLRKLFTLQGSYP